MKKRIIFGLIILLVVQLKLSSSELKYYYDRDNGYSGQSVATYHGTLKSLGIKGDGFSDYVRYCAQNTSVRTRDVRKLTEAEWFLVESALDEFDVEDIEVYSVALICKDSMRGLDVFVYIKNGKMHWIALELLG